MSNLGREHYATLRTGRRHLLQQTIHFSHRQRSTMYQCRMSWPSTRRGVRMSRQQSRTRGCYLLGEGKSRLTKRVMFRAMSGGGNPVQGRPDKNWMQYLYIVDCRQARFKLSMALPKNPRRCLERQTAQKERHLRKAGVESLVGRCRCFSSHATRSHL